ncbi:MAG TPA: M3 family oligoendopeptidase [Chloroflexia bacterium]|nr:M3 family oligoendopeptidase [Chloroflexia bacterium]
MSATSTDAMPRRFVPADLQADDREAIAALYQQLEARPLPDRAALEAWIADWEELNAITDELYNETYVAMTCDTKDEAREARYMRVLEEFLPLHERSNFALQRKLLDAPALGELDASYSVFLRQARTRVELFREENVPLQTEAQKLEQEYEKIIGGEMVEFQGERRTMQQMSVFLEENDRALREEAWRARDVVRAADEAALDDLFDRMLVVRRQIAANAGCKDYREYTFANLLRFDYTPEDCLAFHDAIEHHVVPVVHEFNERRGRLMGVDTLRPWDLRVDPEGQPPLRPFSTVDELITRCRRVFEQVDPELGAFYNTMIERDLLDLGSREGKAPGGYMTSFRVKRVPFIFMNAVGLKRDVDTLLHEGGHAFHYFLARELPLQTYHHTGSEFSEVASQTMEYLSRPYLQDFYAAEDLDRLHADQLREALAFLPFMAMLDAFQHWVYTTPDTDAAARRAKWADLEARFRPDTDWTGLEGARDAGWQYPHVFGAPFYYVEYGISLLAALRIWLNSLEDERAAVTAYKQALALGGSRPLPELFAAAGAKFGMDDAIVREIVQDTVAHIPA